MASLPTSEEAEKLELLEEKRRAEQDRRRFSLFEVFIGFVAAVSAWGFIDSVVEILAKGDKPTMAMFYAAAFGFAMVAEVVARLFKFNFNISSAANFSA